MSNNVLFDVPGPRARRTSRIASIVTSVVIVGGLFYLYLALEAPRVTANGTETPGMFDPTRWDVITDGRMWNAILVRGLLLGTLKMAAVAAVFALLIGVIFSFARTARSKWIRIPAAVLLDFFRGMPVLLLMLFILLIIGPGAYWAGVAGLAIYNGAVIGEALRSGIQSLPKGQRESGLAIGLTPVQTRLIVEFPQAFRQMLPIIIAQLVVLLKDTSLAYIIAYPELLNIGLRQLPTTYGNRYFFTFFFIVLIVYLTVNLLLSWVARIVARRTASGRKTRRTGPTAGKDEKVGVDTAAMNAVMPDSS
ncbi:amino acid ABC transporter membrane protein 2 (PAAT family) [Glaciihabitans tibetensis]|uniref:Amino acid ABC transporter membrane protein 2 (PAAT family) n=1 Tax=Glaciihabitans tibetensis TaxID=1266600 RepID=A0A2T0VHQ1_9MICO|nr:amino acid ABC transporter permease [Glaciihabitans tibetensis]PRY69742.1 amino acid ABC transporter membrane protein 2 (PAAT family) [Glaciihabitans tibetensis]